jgi:hypothetical protein
MCLMCAEFNKGKMTAREVGRALNELNPDDPHLEEIVGEVMKAGEQASADMFDAFMKETNK